MEDNVIQKTLDLWSAGHLRESCLFLKKEKESVIIKNGALLARYLYNSGYDSIAFEILQGLPDGHHDFESEAFLNYTYGFIDYEINQNFTRAKFYFEKSDLNCKKCNLNEDISILRFANNWRLGMIFSSEKKYQEAKKAFEISEDIVKNLDNNHFMNIYLLSQVWVNLYHNDFFNAYDKLFTALFLYTSPKKLDYLNSELFYSLACIEQKTDKKLVHLFNTFQKTDEVFQKIGHGYISNPFEGNKKIYPSHKMHLIYSDHKQLFNRKEKIGVYQQEIVDQFGITPKCTICGSMEDLTIDHIIPYNWGGSNNIKNIRILCRSCNSQKRDLFTKQDYNAYTLLRNNMI